MGCSSRYPPTSDCPLSPPCGKQIRTSEPLTAPPAAVEGVEDANGDSVASIASRYGLTIADIRNLNPGVNLARLALGTKNRIATAAPATTFVLRPVVSVGASWADLPPAAPPLGFGGTGRASPQVDTPEKQRIREQIELNRQRELLAKARREREHQEAFARRYKTFGDCTYDWQSWVKSSSGVRSVKTYPCRGRSEIAVDCQNLKINERDLRRCSGCKIPIGGQVDMDAEVCANTL